MKVLAFNGSGRKNGNTARLIRLVFEELETEGIETELIEMAGKTLHGCSACDQCYVNLDRKCVISDDELNLYIEKMVDAEGLVLGSPVYFANMSSQLKALIDRAGRVVRANGNLLQHKPGAAVVAVRRAGAVGTFNMINNFFTISQMVIPGSVYWNFGFGRGKDEVDQDDEGVKTMRVLGQNLAWLMKKVYA